MSASIVSVRTSLLTQRIELNTGEQRLGELRGFEGRSAGKEVTGCFPGECHGAGGSAENQRAGGDGGQVPVTCSDTIGERLVLPLGRCSYYYHF